MITITGVEVLPGGETAPTLYDIGYGLAQTNRYGGHTSIPWSVYEHSLACLLYAQEAGDSDEVQLHVLLHDAHECVTGEIPRPWKTPDFAAQQADVDRRIRARHGITEPTEEVRKRVKEIDDVILLGEMVVLGPPKKDKPYHADAVSAVRRTQGILYRIKTEQRAEAFVNMVKQLYERVYHVAHNEHTETAVPAVQGTE